MAWFPCNIGSGVSPEPTPIPVSMNVKTTSVSGYTASVKLSTYDDARDVVYSTVMGESNAMVFGAVRLYYDSAWYLKAFTTCEYDGNIYDEGDLIRTWSYTDNVDMKIDYTESPRGNATMKQGTFVSATSQYGIVDVNCGFEPDLVMVKLPFTGGDTTSYWEKGMSWAETKSLWNLYPVESDVYVVDLGRTTGETGIQAINNNGFSFMSNGSNTQGVTCEYIAVKYEVPQPQPQPQTVNILKGTTEPTSAIGENGQLYLKYAQYEKHSFMNGAIIVIENKNDPTDIKLYVDGLTKDSSFLPITDTDLLAYLSDITSGYLKACSTYDTATSTTVTGLLAIGDWGSGIGIYTYIVGWSQYKAGTFYGVIDLTESPVPASGYPTYQDNPYVDPDTVIDRGISDSFAKVNGQWQDLIGTNIDDIANTTDAPIKEISYLKWQITKTRSTPSGSSIQIAEFKLYQNAELYNWDNNVSISSDMAGNSGETIDKLIDGNSNTKYCTHDWGSIQINECNIIINLGETITLTNTSSYCFVTANDEITRDPVSWKLYGSDDGTNWDLLDERDDADIPTDRGRQTFNYPCNISGGSPVVPFEKEILHSILQDQPGSTVPVSVTFTNDYQIAFICGLIADNVRTGTISVNALGGASELYGISDSRYASAGIAIELPSNKTLTGYFPYSDGGAYYDIFGAIGMSRLPSEYEIQATVDTSNISIELSKVYEHIVVFVGMDSGNSNSITLAMNGTSIPLTVESEKFGRYSYHASEELTSDSATLNFTYSGGSVADNTIVVFAYND